jgi:adenylate cyclase class 2
MEFFHSLGCTVYICKEKHGHAWECAGIVLELVEVPPLGWFLEMEILLGDEATAEDVLSARGRLLTLLGVLDVPPSLIEGRYYTDLLLEQHSNGQTG